MVDNSSFDPICTHFCVFHVDGDIPESLVVLVLVIIIVIIIIVIIVIIIVVIIIVIIIIVRGNFNLLTEISIFVYKIFSFC